MLEQGVTIGLGPDWTPSGTDEMLSEMRYAYSYGQAAEISALHQERIWQMATKDGAEALGLGEYVGRLAPEMKADIAVFGRRAEDPSTARSSTAAPRL